MMMSTPSAIISLRGAQLVSSEGKLGGARFTMALLISCAARTYLAASHSARTAAMPRRGQAMAGGRLRRVHMRRTESNRAYDSPPNRASGKQASRRRLSDLAVANGGERPCTRGR
jgi:hypothetical protein